ncbi:MAG TPA: FAD-dependent tricarballylate dehydrogenase TcuA [Dehalococcoidales bacterium]|nr:FAD-dependent tricarballylate dehydrogenase TcuA [Dehalococcoidales bacterium]
MEVKKVIDCDVVVVGGGNAGLVATIECDNLGADVLLLEKAPKEKRGGNSRFTGGVWRVAFDDGNKEILPLLDASALPVPVDSLDIAPYPKDEFYAHAMRVSQGLSEKKWTESLVDKSLPTLQWLVKQGVRFTVPAYSLVKRNGRNYLPPRTTAVEAVNLGEGLVEMEYGILESRRANILYETAAERLIVNSGGEVCGLIARTNEGMIQVNARSVILACGGFEGNPEMRRRYLGEGWDLAKLRGTRYNTGDGLRMALEIGAAPFGHWGGCHASVVSEDSPQVEAEAVGCIRYSYLYCIMVNVNGERFINEGEDIVSYTYAKTGREIAKQPQGLAFQIFDAKVTEYFMPEYQGAIHVESSTLEELAEDAGIDVKGFVKTVKDFNAAIEDDDRPFLPGICDGRRTVGLDPDKTNWARKIDTPPFQAFAVVRGLTFAYGGIKIDDKTRVMDTREKPIAGLYAVGEMPGGLFYHNYMAGSGLMKGAMTGRIAAAEAVARAKAMKK